MSSSDKGDTEVHHEQDLRELKAAAAVETKVVSGNNAYQEAMIKEPPVRFSRSTILLYAASLIGFFCSTMNGYDGSLYNSIAANEIFLNHFHGTNDGIWAGIVSSMYQIGNMVALPFIGPITDTLGRRVGMFSGSIVIIIGTIVSATTTNGVLAQFEAGRFILGFGVGIASSAGPVYVTEISHPAHRGIITAFFNTFWFTGAILASGVTRGALNLGGNISWTLPLWCQLLFSGFIAIFAFFLPESPRWLYVNNKQDKAREMLVKYHGNGNPDSEWVKLQLHEYNENLELDGADKRWWDYRALFNSRKAMYRVYCCCIVSVFGQWAGNAVLSYFISPVLEGAGYRDAATKLNIILINNCQQFIFAIIGSTLVDRVGRRPLLIFSNIACCLVWMCLTISNWEFAKAGGTKTESGTNPAASQATLAFIFIFGSLYSVGFTPLQALYPVEVLSFEMRAKGMAFQTLVMNAAMLLNQFAWPVSMEKIGWHTYIIFCIWDGIQFLVVYFTLPETKNRTLEELEEIFASDRPVKKSLEKRRIGIDSFGEIVKVEAA